MLAIAAQPTEYELKLAYLYNFTKFVSWPESAFDSADSPINICVLGETPAGDAAAQLDGKQSWNRPIAFHQLDSFTPGLSCHVLFISRSIHPARLETIVKSLRTPTLLVGETHDFAKTLGVIGFVVDDQRRIRLEINLDNAQQKQLSIRAQLLEIARTVYRTKERS